MTEEIAAQKNQHRQSCRQIRQALTDGFRLQASQVICAQIEKWPLFQGAQHILSYMPTKAEVDLRPLLQAYPQKNWLLPRILPGIEHSMLFHAYDPQGLVRHPFGMDEPDEHLPVVPPRDIQLALVPGLAFDRQGWRLGYGGGYFDRFLKDFNGQSLGVVFDALLFETLPFDEYDVPMGWIVSEKELFQTRPENA